MKTVKDKYLVVGADFAGFPLKEVVVEHLTKKGWNILDLGVKKDSDPNDTDLIVWVQKYQREITSELCFSAERAWASILRQVSVRTFTQVLSKAFPRQQEPLRETELTSSQWVHFTLLLRPLAI
jgi:hypothetical protein